MQVANHRLITYQAERLDDDGAQLDPPGFHIQPLPFADEVRAAPVESSLRGTLCSLWMQFASNVFHLSSGRETDGSRQDVDQQTDIKKRHIPTR